MKKLVWGLAVAAVFFSLTCEDKPAYVLKKSPDYFVESNADATTEPLIKKDMEGVTDDELYKEKAIIGKWQKDNKKEIDFWERISIGANRGNTNEIFKLPEDIALNSKGQIYICDRGNDRIQVFTLSGLYVQTIGKSGSGNGEFHKPSSICLDKENNLYVADNDNKRIQVFTPTGKFWKEIKTKVSDPRFITVDSKKNIYVQHVGDVVMVRKYDFDGNELTEFGEVLNSVPAIGKKSKTYSQACLGIDAQDNVYLCYRPEIRIDKFSPDGVLLMTFYREMSERHKLQLDKIKEDNQNTNRAHYLYHVSDIFIDYAGRAWITFSDALELYDTDGKLLYHKRMNLATTENIPNCTIITKDNKAIFLNRDYGTVRIFDMTIKDVK